MAGPFADVFFAVAVIAVLIAHAFILRSTIRGMNTGGAGSKRTWEWVWAFLPAIALLVLFVFTWTTMHPSTIRVTLPADRPPVGVGAP